MSRTSPRDPRPQPDPARPPTSAPPAGPPQDISIGGPARELIRSEERLVVGTQWVPTESVLLSRRIVTETVQVQVTVRREELVVTRTPMAGAAPVPGRGEHEQPQVIVLSREVPTIVLDTEAYELVTVNLTRVAGTQEVTASLRAEQIVAETTPGVPLSSR